MGRPPCCDKMGVKKGAWTPEEDIMLVSYVQQNGPVNWRAVPTITGLRRCSKSCRLRWTNYLRPGIKRGNFTDHEEKMIVQLQSLLGNKWAAIASYLPDRTDNDIKNYWNTHLKKKLKKQFQLTCSEGFSSSHSISRGRWETKLQTDINKAKQALQDALSFNTSTSQLKSYEDHGSFANPNNPIDHQACSYASSTENIARLLKDWMENPAKSTSSSHHAFSPENKTGLDLSETFESIYGFESFDHTSNNSDFCQSVSHDATHFQSEIKSDLRLTMLENWLFDEVGIEGKEDLSKISFDHGHYENYMF